ncbi:sulfatase [bacterium]|jgi:arylsulfatase A-like enzyme|nr:sulfatase [Verrucomicrobiota bacterium]MDA7633435.1 sulfatase [bacterium]MDA7645031.1 sulfatase [bacterium]
MLALFCLRQITLVWLVVFVVTPLLADDKRPPNLLVIYTDEHHFNTLGCYGGKIVETPHIDSIAASGARCTSFYAATPVCSPSRASLISGKYPQNTGVVQNNMVLNNDIVSFGEVLRREGYATGWAGKWHLAGEGKPQWEPPKRFGFQDNRFMFNRGHWKKLSDENEGPSVGSQNAKGQPDYGLVGADERSYTTDWLVTKTIQFIEKNQDQPFCYVVSLPDPHGPNRVRAPYNTMYVGTEIPIPESLLKPASGIPSWAPPNPRINPRWLRANMPQYYGMVKCIDDNIGRLLTTLRRRDLLDNTLILFTSDHGDLCGEHGRSEKGVPYEGSARVPFLLSYPGVVPGNLRIDEAMSTVDVMPTLMGLLGVDAPSDVNGRDASALFRGEKAKDWEDIAFIRSTKGNPWIAAITDDLKLVLSVKDDPWLFDLEEDPGELTNRIEQPAYRESIRDLARALKAYQTEIGDSYLDHPAIRDQLRSLLVK